jgi:hypothetical protein
VLIYVTQALLAIAIVLQVYALIMGLLALPRALASSLPWSSLLLAFSATSAILVLASMLFHGLARARRWAWHGGVAFAVLLLVMVFYSRANPAVPPSEIPANQLFGAAIGELLITVLVVLYPIRMYFSKKVRLFLGV